MKHTVGNTNRIGRSVCIQTLEYDGNQHVILTCDGGNVSFQHGMTATEARQLASYLIMCAADIEANALEAA